MARCWLWLTHALLLVVIAMCASAVGQPTVQVVEQAADPEYTVQFAFTAPEPWPDGGEIRVLFERTESGDGYGLIIDGKGCRFARIDGGRMRGLGMPGTLALPAGPCRGVLKRRQSRMTALINSDVAATAQDTELHGGAVAWMATDDALSLSDIYVQPIAPVEFTDDFVREKGSFGAWETVAGDWQTVAPEGEEVSPDKSANPFSLRAAAGAVDALALATAGDWFWDEYEVEVAAQAASAGAMGVAAYVQDADNFLLFRWTSLGKAEAGEPEGRKQLVRVREGEWSVLAQVPGGFRPECWYELSLAVCDGRIVAGVDGAEVLTAYDPSFGQGKIGLFAQEVDAVHFDDVAARTTADVAQDFEDNGLGWLRAENGEWKCELGHLYGSAGGAGSAEAWVGEPDWAHYRVVADVKPKSARAIGLQACRQADGQRYVFRWEKDGRQVLLLAREHTQTVLAEGSAPMAEAQFYRLGLSVWHGRVVGSVDGQTVLEAANTQLTSGPAGLFAAGPGEACFDNLGVKFTRTEAPEFRVTAQFTREETMKNWVDPSRQWQQGDDGTLWYDVPLFGDFTLWLPQTDLVTAGGKLTIGVAPQAGSGIASRLILTTDAGSPVVAGQALQGDTVIAESAGEVTPDAPLQFIRGGTCLSVWSGDRPVLACRDDGFAGQALGVFPDGLELDMSGVLMDSPHLMDVTFAGAPTGWVPSLGVWKTTDRWPCARGWSWFGGSGHESPLLWSKDTFEGDQVLEFWAGVLMDMDKEPGYSHPSDLNATICGDGANLCSGYSFVLAGANNTKSMIMKGNQIVAENPEVKFENPVSMNFKFHRHWFDIRVEKRGNHLSFAVDGQRVAEWTDPDPLPAGKAGFWSWNNNGVLIARARVAAETIRR